MKVVITGATKGIGRAVASVFSKRGTGIAVCARNEKELKAVVAELSATTDDIIALACDLSQRDEVKKFIAAIKSKWETVDVLVNNAGTFVPGKVIDEAEGVMEEVMNVNFFSAYYLTRGLLPLMIKQNSGHIFNMCSVASLKAYHNGGSYSISKHALLGFSRALREELKEYNIKVTTLLPGAVFTPSWESAQLPEERFMKTTDVADLIFSIYSLSPSAVVEEVILRPLQGDI